MSWEEELVTINDVTFDPAHEVYDFRYGTYERVRDDWGGRIMKHFLKRDCVVFRQAVQCREVQTVLVMAAVCDDDTVCDLFLSIGYDEDDLSLYDFVVEIIQREETARWHEVASLLLSQPLCHHVGAYERSFSHALRAAELDPDDIRLKEYVLFFQVIPEKLLSDEEAERLALHILNVSPSSHVARQHIFSESGRRELGRLESKRRSNKKTKGV